MRSIDFLAIGCAVLSLLSFVSSSSSFQFGRASLGTLKLLMGTVALVLGVAAGFASIGTDGYIALEAEAQPVATATITPRGADSLSARVTWPDGITRTFNVAGHRVRFEVRVLRWREVGFLVGADEMWEFAGMSAQYSDGLTADGSVRDLRLRRPVHAYDMVLKYPALSAIAQTDLLSIELLANGVETALVVSQAGLEIGN